MKKNFQFSIFNFQFQRGFTLLELILYIGIVSIVLTSLVTYAWNVIGIGEKSATEQEVFSNARYLSERIKYEIRNALDINSVSASSISLKGSGGSDPTVISLSGNNLLLTQGVGPTPAPLNSSDVKVTNLIFTDYTDYVSGQKKTKNIAFTLSVETTYTGARQEFKEKPVTIESSAEVRSN